MRNIRFSEGLKARRFACCLSAIFCLGLASASAGENTIGIALATQRDPTAFDKSVSTVTAVSYSHAFDNNAILAASLHYFDVSGSSAWHLNSQIGIGYRLALSDAFAVIGTVNIGSRAQSDDVNFPYYSLQGALDWKLTEALNWSVLTYRYRNAFSTGYDFETPALGTSVGLRLTDHSSISLNYLREWDDGKVADDLLGLGYQFHF